MTEPDWRATPMGHILAALVVLALLVPTIECGRWQHVCSRRPKLPHCRSRVSHFPVGRPLLFCGDKFIALLVVGFLTSDVKGHVVSYGPAMEAFRKSDIERVALHLETGARVHFKDGAVGKTINAADTWTDARAILECLD